MGMKINEKNFPEYAKREAIYGSKRFVYDEKNNYVDTFIYCDWATLNRWKKNGVSKSYEYMGNVMDEDTHDVFAAFKDAIGFKFVVEI